MADYIPQLQTKTIQNFRGSLTRLQNGDMDSGMAKFSSSFGYEPFAYPYNLHWQEAPTQIDPGATVITDMVLKMKERVESGVPYVYGVDYAGRLYKITASNETCSLVLSTGKTLHYGGGMEFFKGVTEKVYIGHDNGVISVNFDGSGQSDVTGGGVSFVVNVPHPMAQFGGALYIANDTNLAQLGTIESVTNSAVLNPSLPNNYHIVDLDVTADGRYLIMLGTRNPILDVKTVNPVDYSANQDSALFFWNGSDGTYTSYEIQPSFIMTAVNVASPTLYEFGYDIAGAVVRDETQKILTLTGNRSPLPGAIDWNGNLVGWGVPESYNGHLVASSYIYGSLDAEFPIGWWRHFRASATGTNTDVMTIGCQKIVSNLSWQSNSYIPQTWGKFYYSTYETGGTPASKLYKAATTPPAGGATIGGVWESLNQLFTQKIGVQSVRFYVEPTVAGNGFQMDLIGSDGTPITGGTKTYTYSAGSDPTQVQGALDLIEFANLLTRPTYSLGIRITNTGTTNMIFHKVEIDYVQKGR